MSGTVHTPADLMTNEIVDNTTGLITPVRVRDAVESLAALPIYATTETASFSVNAIDMRGTMILVNSASGVTATLVSDATTAFPVGALIHFRPTGVGMITFTNGAGATVTAGAGTPIISRATGSWVTAHKTAANTWWIDGDLT